ncbi:MAG: hypothetical protein AB7L65_04595 [Hyphomonadaceae bacterium]
MSYLRAFPLMALPAIVYALFALPLGVDAMRAGLAAPAFTLSMASHAQLVFTRGHLMTIFAIMCLFLEVARSTRPTGTALVENSFSVLLFILMLIAFLLGPAFATGEFFLIMLMCLLAFMSGATVMLFTARRTVEYDH